MRTATEAHWDERARTVEDERDVNTTDVWQRELEYDEVMRHLRPDMKLLEIGCGNGFSTNRLREHVRHVDAFDFSPSMVERAKRAYGETNNRFIHDDLLDPQHLDPPYDAVTCVRVLINLPDLDAQQLALRTIASLLRDGGTLVLVEGFIEAFAELSELRVAAGLEPVHPSSVNAYPRLDDILSAAHRDFDVVQEFHLGAYDYLTRVVYPAFVAPESPHHNSKFSEIAYRLSSAFNPDAFAKLARVRGYVMRKTAAAA